MSIASIMVSLDLGATVAARVHVSAGLAKRFEATLTGVAARKIPNPGPGHDLAEIQSAYDEEQAKLAQDLRRCGMSSNRMPARRSRPTGCRRRPTP